MARKPKTIIGWEEWCELPDLGLPAIKAKIDTGAKTSAIHAFDIETFTEDGNKFVRFKIHPIQGSRRIKRECVAPLIDQRTITSSNGEREKRYVILTPIIMGSLRIKAELTLTSRHKMRFRMLLGREALRKAKLVVDPSKTFLLGKTKSPETLY